MRGLSPNLVGAVYMVLSMAAFTLNDAMVKLLSANLPLFQIVFLRGIFTTIMLAVFVHLTTGLSLAIPPQDRVRVGLRTLIEILTMVAFLTALINMPIANATAILASLPLAVTLGAALVFGHPIGWRRLTAILVGFVGVIMIVQPGTDGFNVYALFALLAVLLVTARDLITRTFSPAVPSMTVAVLTAAAVGIFGGILSIFETWVGFGWRELLILLAGSFFIIGGYVFSILVMRVGEISFTSPFRYTSLVWALVLGLVLFNEWPNALALAGACVVAATGLFTLWREHAVQETAHG